MFFKKIIVELSANSYQNFCMYVKWSFTFFYFPCLASESILCQSPIMSCFLGFVFFFLCMLFFLLSIYYINIFKVLHFFWFSGFAEFLFVTKLCHPCFLCLSACSVAFSLARGKVLGFFVFNLFYFLINAFKAINFPISNTFFCVLQINYFEVFFYPDGY